MIEFVLFVIGLLIMLALIMRLELDRYAFFGLLVCVLLISPIIYSIFVFFPQTQPEAQFFCESMGFHYSNHAALPSTGILFVKCSQVIQDCPTNKCMLIEKKIRFDNYPEKTGEVVYD